MLGLYTGSNAAESTLRTVVTELSKLNVYLTGWVKGIGHCTGVFFSERNAEMFLVESFSIGSAVLSPVKDAM